MEHMIVTRSWRSVVTRLDHLLVIASLVLLEMVKTVQVLQFSQPLLTVAIQLNDFKSVKVITNSLRHPSHFLEKQMGKIGCPSSKHRKVWEFSANT